MRRMKVVWRDASTPTVAQAADAAVKKRQQGITTLRQTRIDLGYAPEEIRRMEEEDEAEARRDPVRRIADELNGARDAAPVAESPPAPVAEPASVG